MKKNTKWSHPRHRIIQTIACMILHPYCKWKYGIKIEKFKEQEDRPYLILYNHQTVFDQFFVGISFKKPVYYLATEDIFSLGWISSLLRYLVAPIPIKKQTADFSAVMACLRIAKEGGTIALAPEGNRTYSGKTEYINPAIATMAKKMKLPIALYRIEGGYGVQPRWGDKLRKGKMRSYVHKVIAPEEYAELSTSQLYDMIVDGLDVNDKDYPSLYLSSKRAEYLERAMYVCPYCGLSEFESSGNHIHCKKCFKKIHYGKDKKLEGVGFEFPFKFVGEWYEAQKDFINNLDVNQYVVDPLYIDKANLSEVIIRKKKNLLRQDASLALYGDRIIIDKEKADSLTLPFSELSSVAVLGRNKVNIYHGEKVYQIKGDKRFNGLKYVNIYYRYKNMREEKDNGKFLGL